MPGAIVLENEAPTTQWVDGILFNVEPGLVDDNFRQQSRLSPRSRNLFPHIAIVFQLCSGFSTFFLHLFLHCIIKRDLTHDIPVNLPNRSPLMTPYLPFREMWNAAAKGLRFFNLRRWLSVDRVSRSSDFFSSSKLANSAFSVAYSRFSWFQRQLLPNEKLA